MDRKIILCFAVLVLIIGGCQRQSAESVVVVVPSPIPPESPIPPDTSQPPPATEEPRTATAGQVESTSMLTATAPIANAPTQIIPPAETVSLPPGFGISIFVPGLRDPRMMTVDPSGQVVVAERGTGRIIRLPDRDEDGVADGIEVVAEGLNEPSSIAYAEDGSLYVGETRRVLHLHSPDDNGVFTQSDVVVSNLPSGGHSTRTVLFSPDYSALYVSVGSSCNVCVEDDTRRATIMRYTPSGASQGVFASGLRNAVGITFRPGSDELWASNNGRDWLGDDSPPETIYRVGEGDDAGWPACHAGRIIDPDFGSPGSCDGILEPVVEIQAHSAPLGITFYAGNQFPAEYHGNLFVALHGSWNRTTPTGYKVVRVSVEGAEVGPVEDFAMGWLRPNGTNWGRPVDVLTGSDGSLFVSDDGAGIIYRIFYAGES